MNANLYDVLRRGFPTSAARSCFELPDGSCVSYAEVDRISGQLASYLIGGGVSPGDRVAVQGEKSVAQILLYLGCLRAGAVFVPFNPASTPVETEALRADAEAGLFITDPADVVRRATGAPVMTGSVPRQASDPASMIYTSGTTGRPKGAVLSHGALAANATALHSLWGFNGADRLIHALPVFHVHGLFVALHCALLAGCPMIWLPKFSEEEVMRAFGHATVLMGVPTFYTRLLARPDFGKAGIGAMRLFISGSAPLSEAVFSAFEARTGHRILERYGMSEAVIITSNPLQGDRIAGSVGFPLAGVDVRISGAQSEGVLEIRGESLFSGYWRLPEKTAEDFTPDGYFRTGDIGRIDPDGRVWISGRARDLVITGGLNVYPKEVELVIDDIPGVEESAVIGLPHPDLGEGVTAVIVGSADEAEILSACRLRLAPYKAPKRVVIVPELPRNAMGKVQKAALRERLARLYLAD
jgi:malonyl-CoA/methylmalonyl-CoA synthetase